MQLFLFTTMKIFITADWHFGVQSNGKIENGINSRIHDISIVIDSFIKDVRKNKPDIVIIAGDLFHTNKPSPYLINLVTSKIVELAKYSKVVIIPGNHDQSHNTSAVQFLGTASLPNVYASELPIIHHIDDCTIACFPYPRKSVYGTDDNYMLNVAEDIYRLEDTSDAIGASYRFLVTHLTCQGFSYGIERGMAILTESNIDYETLTNYEWDAVFMGHIHQQQYKEIDGIPIMYVGSPMVMDFGEEGQSKGYYVWEDNEIYFIELKHRKYQTVRIKVSDDENAQQYVENIVRNTVFNSTAIVRIIIETSQQISIQPLFKLLKHLYHVSGIQVKRPDRKLIEDEEGEKIDITTFTPSDLMELWLYNNGVEDDDELDTLLDLFEELSHGKES